MDSTSEPRSYIDHSQYPESVLAMLTDPAAPTAPLADFIEAYRRDDNIWWRIGSGHHQNLFETACEAAGIDVVVGPLAW